MGLALLKQEDENAYFTKPENIKPQLDTNTWPLLLKDFSDPTRSRDSHCTWIHCTSRLKSGVRREWWSFRRSRSPGWWAGAEGRPVLRWPSWQSHDLGSLQGRREKLGN